MILPATGQLGYATLALGSALALFLYPHSITGVLAASNRDVLKRNMSALPIYSLALGLIALLGFMAIAAGTKPIGTDGNTIVPVLFQQMFPSWFAGIAFAAIGIGALVPAAIMSIAAANLFTRNIYKEYLKKDATPQQEAQGRQDRLAGGQAGRGRGDPVPQPAVLHRPAADRWRDHPADAAVGGAGPLHPLAAPRRADRRLGRGHGDRAAAGLQHPEAQPRRDGGPGALRRLVVRAVQARVSTPSRRSTPGSWRCWST